MTRERRGKIGIGGYAFTFFARPVSMTPVVTGSWHLTSAEPPDDLEKSKCVFSDKLSPSSLWLFVCVCVVGSQLA